LACVFFLICTNFYNLDSRHWCRTITSKHLPVCNGTEIHKASGLMVSAFLQYGNCHSGRASQLKYCPAALITWWHLWMILKWS